MTPIFRFAQALGRIDAGWRFAPADLRRCVGLALIADAWAIVRRDAGPGQVGPAHEASSTHLLFTEDARRDAVRLWLADHAAPGLREAAAWLARMVEAEIRFGTADRALLEAARAALAKAGLATLRPGGIIDHAPPAPAPVASLDGPSLMHAVAAVDRDLAAIDHLYERQKAA